MKKNLRKVLALILAVLTCSAMLGVFVSAGVNGTQNVTVDALYMPNAIVFDGNISKEEWGDPTYSVVVQCARKNFEFDDNNNISVSDFCYMDPSALKYINPLSFDIYLRWDADNFYIGVVALDPYGLSVYPEHPMYYEVEDDPTSELINIDNLWSGDALQFAMSRSGPNASGNPLTPFADDDNAFYYIFSTLTSTATAPDREALVDTYLLAEVRHNVKDPRLVKTQGAMRWHNEQWINDAWEMCGKSGGNPVNGNGTVPAIPGYLVFELAVPVSSYNDGVKNAADDLLGLTLARVSGTTANPIAVAGGDPKYFPRGVTVSGDFSYNEEGLIAQDVLSAQQGGYESWCSWGDGVMGSAADQPAAFRSGSNGVRLSSENAVEPAGPSEPEVLRGDVNGDGVLTNADAIYLLRNIMLGDSYPINQGGDMNGDGTITNADAIYLLRNIMLGDSYPLADDTIYLH